MRPKKSSRANARCADWPAFFRAVPVDVPSRARLTELLHDAVRESARNGYHVSGGARANEGSWRRENRGGGGGGGPPSWERGARVAGDFGRSRGRR